MIVSCTSSCFVSNEIQQWDVSDLTKPRLTSTLVPGVQPNMMHVTGDGKRMYIYEFAAEYARPCRHFLGTPGSHRAGWDEDGPVF